MKEFDAYLESELKQLGSGLFEPARYILQLGGKRIRPRFAIEAFRLYSSEIESAFPLALAIELFHNFTLIHDDIMDQATMRRGSASAHLKYGVNQAILTGDAMLILSYQYLDRYDDAISGQLLSRMNTVALDVCEGQQMDMDFEEKRIVTVDEYLHMIELKTSVLMAGALWMGAVAGGGTPREAQFLYDYGISLGKAFQIRDDYLDAFGDPGLTGKKKGGDILQNKKTFLMAQSQQSMPEDEWSSLEELIRDNQVPDTGKVSKTIAVFEKYEIPQLCRKKEKELLQEAMGFLGQLNKSEKDLDYFYKISGRLTERGH